MRRRLFLLLLWLVGTVGATSLVFGFLSRLGTDLGTVPQLDRISQQGAATTLPLKTTVEVTATRPTTATTALVTIPETVETATTEVSTSEPEEVTEPTRPSTPAGATTRPPLITVPGTQAPVQTTRPTTAPSVPETTQPTAAPTTAPIITSPPTTAPPAIDCSSPRLKAVSSNIITYKTCGESAYFVAARPAAGWAPFLIEKGPPRVVVRFESASGSSVTCSISLDSDGIVAFGGDC